MAIRLIDQYPNRAGVPDASYPHGIPRNKSTPTATDGTPFEQAWFRDKEGFMQGLLETAGITPSGSPDTVENSDYLDALVQLSHGVVDVDVAGDQDTTLAIYPSRFAAIRLTGGLAADVDLIVPDTKRLYWIINETTGGYSVTVRTAAREGVTVSSDTSVLRCDGNDVFSSNPGPTGVQFSNYDFTRTYTTGEIARGSDGVFYEFYDRDQVGTVSGVDPTDAANRPHVWMAWDGVRPGTVIEWRSETLPEGYVENDGASISRSAYRRIFSVYGTTHGVGDGSTTFNLPNDRGEFKRGWDHGRGVDVGRGLAAHQEGTIVIGDNNTTPAIFMAKDAMDLRADSGGGLSLATLQYSAASEITETTISGSSYLGVTRPRNNAVIYLTKI